jgi:glycosyltransferase involved in cell wall biosynthesis
MPSMKVIIQVPAYDEAETLPDVLADLPRTIAGATAVEVLVIDDGSRDGTAAVALAAGADHVVRHTANRGLAVAFQTGIDACLRLGADVIVNTDADGQYPGAAVPALVAPILQGQADIVIGDRQVRTIAHFSPAKKLLQRLGSWVVRLASGTSVPDAPSGFRAYSREAALRLLVTTDFSYTVENVIQAGKRHLAIAHLPVQIVRTTRPSRLYRGTGYFIKRQAATIARSYATYEPLRTFVYLGLPILLVGLILLVRLAVLYVVEGFTLAGHLQSLVVGVAALILAFVIFQFGLLADRIGDNRRLIEELLYRQRRHDLEHGASEQASGERERVPAGKRVPAGGRETEL